MIPIPITVKERALARELQGRIFDHINKEPSYTGLMHPDRFYYGYLGEIALYKLLREHKRKAEYTIQATGKSDGGRGDFFVFFIEKGKKTVDVKTATKPTHKRIMQPKLQRGNYYADWYVGARMVDNDSVCELHGYCAPDDFILDEQGFVPGSTIPTLYQYLDQLTPIEELLEALESGEVKVNILLK